jgi:hypothetical protein
VINRWSPAIPAIRSSAYVAGIVRGPVGTSETKIRTLMSVSIVVGAVLRRNSRR